MRLCPLASGVGLAAPCRADPVLMEAAEDGGTGGRGGLVAVVGAEEEEEEELAKLDSEEKD